ncbi:MAG: peptide ABC transporter substrate-binding protein [Candidatus Eremiobacteraeota bacterium]|nr:peptide ABC transporter substrate-binding protein [Candidatus Eremiobacteraeota bacterium]
MRFAFLLLLVLASCTRADSQWGMPGEARIVQLGDIWNLNPLTAFGQRLIDLTQIYAQPLVGVSPDNRAIPILCEEVPRVENGGISRDARTITYHLRRGVRFADGVEFTSHDVVFTYRAAIDSRNAISEMAPYLRVASVDAPDKYTVVFHLKAPWSGAPRELFAASDYIFGILPAHAFHDNTDMRRAAWNNRPFGTGPFYVTQWRRGDRVVMERNPYSWQHPKLQRLIVRIVPDENAALVAIRAHEVDFTDITADQVEQMRPLRDVSLIAVPRNESDQLELQTQGDAMRDRRMREAVAYAIDRATLARTVYRGLSPLATTEVPPLFPEHDGSIVARTYDPSRARALVRAAGYTGEVRVAFNNAESMYRSAATVVQQNLRDAGMNAVLRGAAPSVLYGPAGQGGIYYGGRFDVAVSGWYGGLDPETSEPWICANRAPNGPNLARWCDAPYDGAFNDQQRTLDPVRRTQDFHTMQQRMSNNVTAVFMVYRTEYEAINPSLRGVAPNMLYNFGQTQDWSLQ